MKNTWRKLRWLFDQSKPVTFYIVMIMILGIFLSLNGILRAITSKQLLDTATASIENRLFKVLILFAVCLLFDLLLRSCISIVTTKCTFKLSNSIQQKLYAHLMKVRWLTFSKYHSGDFLTRITSDVDAVTSMLTNTLPIIITLSTSLIGSFITILYLEPYLALMLIIISPSSILLSYYYSSKLKKSYIEFQELESKYRSFINESIQNMIVTKTFCLEDKNINTINKLQKDRYKTSLYRTIISIKSNFVLSLGYWSGYFLVFCWSAYKLSKGEITFGTLTAMTQLIENIQSPISGLASSLSQIISAIGSSERLIEIEELNTDAKIGYSKNIYVAGIAYENIYFSYTKDNAILENVSVKINPGETVALIGPSGEGKTTFIHLLLSLINPEQGNIFISNTLNKIEVSAETRKLISYVPQGNTLFSGSILDNLRVGNKNVTEEEIKHAAKAACAWDFIEELPEGLNTKLGENGTGISVGQAQRLSIARALLRDSPILILDEATSALDENTELKVLEAIKNLMPSPTCIIITHRTRSLSICNRVLKLEKGHLIESNSINYNKIINM
ncbi:MAG: ABC transporter ATP-binding protein [Clostridiaceae bacterium]